MLDSRLQLSATAFYSDYTDMQSTGDKVVGVDQNPDSPNFGEPVTAWTTDNLSSSRIKGLELELDLIPWRDGRFSGYVAWLDTAITDAGSFTDGYACAEREIYGQPLCGDPSVSNVEGNQLPFSPKYALHFNYQHHIAMKASYALEPRVTLRWQSKMWFDILNYDGDHLSQAQKSYTKVDVAMRLNGPDDRFYSELFVENATDQDTKNFFGFNRGYVKGMYDPPRTYGLRAGYSFGR
jgi:iron complex outermembrane receptor protein